MPGRRVVAATSLVSTVKRIFTNFRLLALGRIAASLLNLGAITVMARTLSLNEFGTVVLVFIYLLTIRVLGNLKSFLAVVRWGVPALDNGDRETLTRLLVLTKRVDWCAAIAAAVLALALSPAIGAVLGWNDRITGYVMAFSAVLLVSGTGTATGFLRLMNRFDAIAVQNTVGPAVRFLGALGGWFLKAPIDVFVVIWCLSLGVESASLNWRGWRECRVHDYSFSVFDRTSLSFFPGVARFLRLAYVQNVLDLVPHRFANIAVGAMLGAESAGLYRAASECYTVVARPGVLLRQIVFPDLTRLWTNDRSTFRLVILRVCIVAGAIGVCFAVISVFLGSWLMAGLFGEDFHAAGGLLTWLLVSAAFELAGSALRPAGYAMNRSGSILISHLGGTLVLVFSFYPLLTVAGLTGAGIAIGAGAIVTWIAMTYAVAR